MKQHPGTRTLLEARNTTSLLGGLRRFPDIHGFNLDVPRLAQTDGKAIPFYIDLHRIAKRGVSVHPDFSPFGEAHVHQATAKHRGALAVHASNSGALASIKLIKRSFCCRHRMRHDLEYLLFYVGWKKPRTPLGIGCGPNPANDTSHKRMPTFRVWQGFAIFVSQPTQQPLKQYHKQATVP